MNDVSVDLEVRLIGKCMTQAFQNEKTKAVKASKQRLTFSSNHKHGIMLFVLLDKYLSVL